MKPFLRALHALLASSILIGLLVSVAMLLQAPAVDREGYQRDPSLLRLFAFPVESAYRASVIKSIQTDTITINGATSATKAISAVVTANTVVSSAGFTTVSGTDDSQNPSCVSLTNTTTVTATRIGATGAVTHTFMAVEYYPSILKSNQEFNVPITNTNTTGTATISAVTVAKTLLAYRGATFDTNTFDHRLWLGRLDLTNTTTVTGTRTGTLDGLVLCGTAVEFR